MIIGIFSSPKYWPWNVVGQLFQNHYCFSSTKSFLQTYTAPIFENHSCFIFIWCAKIFWRKSFANGTSKTIPAAQNSLIIDSLVLVRRIGSKTICTHLPTRETFLNCQESQHSDTIRLLYKEKFYRHHPFAKLVQNGMAHAISLLKHFRRLREVFHKVVLEKLCCKALVLAFQVCSTPGVEPSYFPLQSSLLSEERALMMSSRSSLARKGSRFCLRRRLQCDHPIIPSLVRWWLPTVIETLASSLTNKKCASI